MNVLVVATGPHCGRLVRLLDDAGFAVDWTWRFIGAIEMLTRGHYDAVLAEDALGFREFASLDKLVRGMLVPFDPDADAEAAAELCRYAGRARAAA